MQLYSKLAESIATGQMKPSEQLPSKRALATHLGISVNTVDGAYQMLLEEGYVTSRPRSGYYVADLPDPVMLSPRPVSTPPALSPPKPDSSFQYDLGTSLVDPDVFPFVTWARLTKHVLTRGRSLLVRGEGQGEADLRIALTEHLREFRGVNARAEQVVIGAGMEYLLGILAKLTGAESVYALEDPGYIKVRHILENNGVCYQSVAMDTFGMRADLLRMSGAHVAYVTPTHQYPMGTTMPVGRRLELIAWAEEQPERYIVEDDYDSEFRYSGRPVPAMSGLTASERVIYIGTMSRSIAPSIRVAYMILPEALLTVYHRRFGMYACTVSVFEQHTMAVFITGGHLTRHLNRMRTLCRKRRDALMTALTEVFGERVRIRGVNLGLHLLVTLSDGPHDTEMSQRAALMGVRLHALSEFAASTSTVFPGHTVVIGYAALNEKSVKDLVERLKTAWK